MKKLLILALLALLAPVSAFAQGYQLPALELAPRASAPPGVLTMWSDGTTNHIPLKIPGASVTTDDVLRWASLPNLVTDFGADPTGSVDATSALQAAVNSGKPFYVPSGTYTWSGAVTDPNFLPIVMFCSGPATTNFNITGSLTISQTGSFTTYVQASNCGFNFTGSSQISLIGTTYNNSQPLQGPLFDNDAFNVPSGYTGAGPVLNFSYVSSGRIVNSTGLINAYGTSILTNYIEIAGTSMNWSILGNRFWDNINPSNTSNVTTGLFLNGSGSGGIQGTLVEESEFAGFNKNIFIGPNNNTVQLVNNMFDQGYYGVYVSGSGINDVRIAYNYIATSANANSGSSAVYVGAASNVKMHANIISPYNSGNYSIDMSSASAGNMTEFDNSLSGSINYGTPFSSITTNSPLSAPNVENKQMIYSTSTNIPISQAGQHIFFTGTSAATFTLPPSTDYESVSTSFGSAKIVITNSGSATLTVAAAASDTGGIYGPSVLYIGDTATYFSSGENKQWASHYLNNIFSSNLRVPNGYVLSEFPLDTKTDTAITATTGTTLTAAQIDGSAVIIRTGPTAAFTDTTDTAANIIAGLGNPPVNSRFRLRYINATGVAATFAAGSGVTINGNSGVGPIVTNSDIYADVDFIITSTTTITANFVGFGSY